MKGEERVENILVNEHAMSHHHICAQLQISKRSFTVPTHVKRKLHQAKSTDEANSEMCHDLCETALQLQRAEKEQLRFRVALRSLRCRSATPGMTLREITMNGLGLWIHEVTPPDGRVCTAHARTLLLIKS